jgi:hypothetical protein
MDFRQVEQGDACLVSNLFFWYNSKVSFIQVTLYIGIVQQFKQKPAPDLSF